MHRNHEASKHLAVYTTKDGRAVIEQLGGSVVLTSEQILTVIRELKMCYDYCAAWKDPPGLGGTVSPG